MSSASKIFKSVTMHLKLQCLSFMTFLTSFIMSFLLRKNLFLESLDVVCAVKMLVLSTKKNDAKYSSGI